jgi:hypothetical protein
VRDADLFVAIGDDAAQLLSTQVSSAKLRDDPVVVRALDALGSDAALALIAEPLHIDPLRADSGPAPAVFALGRRGSDLWVRLEVADLLLREAVRLGAGL